MFPKKDDTCLIAQIYRQHYHALYEQVLAITACAHAAEDILHDVFLKLLSSTEPLSGVLSPIPYIHQSCRNKAKTYLKRRKMEMERGGVNWSMSRDYDLNDWINKKEVNQSYEKAISGLSRRERQVYELKQQVGASQKVIAATLGISPFTVKATLQNATRSIKSSMRRDMGGI